MKKILMRLMWRFHRFIGSPRNCKNSKWQYYWRPKRLTLKSNPAIYRWFELTFSWAVKSASWDCFSGNDAELLYYLECRYCGTVVVEDGSDERCLEYKYQFCPICYPQEDYPWAIYTLKEQKETACKELLLFRRRMGLI